MPEKQKDWRDKLHTIIFEAETKNGKIFDVVLIFFILLSVVIVMLDSMEEVRIAYQNELYVAEWFFTIIFSIEYILRILALSRPLAYAKSFFGIVDLLSILPTYLGFFLPGTHYLVTIRILRILRVFRVLKLVQYVGESTTLIKALVASKRKIIVFLFAVLTSTIILGSMIYIVEGKENGFTSIPRSIYWAIVTLTTVGYGDISPQTNFGQFIASIAMIMGYGIIAVPTGIVTVEMSKAMKATNTQNCINCGFDEHDNDAKFCKICGKSLF